MRFKDKLSFIAFQIISSNFKTKTLAKIKIKNKFKSYQTFCFVLFCFV